MDRKPPIMSRNRPVKLLVSVRNAAEARIAREAGVDILDVKEPRFGSLGRADEQTWREIAIQDANSKIPLSLAAGELRDFSIETRPFVPPGVSFLKLGLAGMKNEPDWRLAWQLVRTSFESRSRESPSFDCQPHFRWVAVIYADAAANAPSAGDILKEAALIDCAGVLVDTFHKDGRNLFDNVTSEQCRAWRQEANEAGMFFALAGSLQLADLPRVAEIRPQIVAVRSAVCREGDRGGMIDASRVTDWVQTLRAAQLSASS